MRSTVKYKSFSHWFSYHWGWFLGGALLLLLVWSSLNRSAEPDPDYIISWVGTSYLSEAEAQAVSDAAARAGADQNGDGLIHTAVYQYIIDFSLAAGDAGFEDNYANVIKLLAQLQTKECYLYLMEDPEAFQRATGVLRYLDGSIPGEDGHYESANWERMCVPWQPEGLEHDAWLGRRSLFDGGDPQTLFPGGDALFEALAAGQ